MVVSECLGEWGRAPYLLVPKSTFTDIFDNTFDISDFRAHIFCPQTTLGLPKKHSEAGPPEHTDTLDTVKIACAKRTTQRAFLKI